MKTIHPMPTHCPITGEPLEVTRLECPQSGIVLEGRFAPNEFALLSDEHLEFMRLYIKMRGNLKEVERMMGVSYPTVRAKFENMLKVLGYELELGNKNDRDEVISLLEAGEISAAEASKRLKAIKR